MAPLYADTAAANGASRAAHAPPDCRWPRRMPAARRETIKGWRPERRGIRGLAGPGRRGAGAAAATAPADARLSPPGGVDAGRDAAGAMAPWSGGMAELDPLARAHKGQTISPGTAQACAIG